ncbi:MAG: D-aminoacyl-tRNA deacylase, partial [Sphingobacterium sp.]
MRAVIQRVSKASCTVENQKSGSIEQGLVILIGIEDQDDEGTMEWLCQKLVKLRIFSDEKGLMNRSIQDIQGNILLISQFTLFAATKKGNRPS